MWNGKKGRSPRRHNKQIVIGDNTCKSWCRLCGERDETINHIISECSKLAQSEYKTRHDWVGKVIHWELCKKFKFEYTNKWYMHKLESIQETETHKIVWGFEIQTYHPISARRPDLVIVNNNNNNKKKKKKKKRKKEKKKKKKRTCRIENFAVSAFCQFKFSLLKKGFSALVIKLISPTLTADSILTGSPQ